MSITYKDEAGIEGMRVACRLASEVLDYLTPLIQPGVTTLEIDRLAAEFMKQQGTVSATIGYQPSGYPPYPGHLCTSINHVVCHGIPNEKPLKKGDILNVDVTVIKDGWFGDNSRMYMIGGEAACSVQARRLTQVTYEAMWKGIVMVKPGMTFTIEPMINAGKRDIKEARDGWTIVTRDRSLSAQWEHTVLVTETGYEVLTLSAGSLAPPAFVTPAAAVAA
jgi:methionyl aminopeptidase